MAGYGPPPADVKRRRNEDVYAGQEVSIPANAVVVAPALPRADQYSEATLTWYANWCSAPQAATFVVTDWQRLHMLAPLVDRFWADPDSKIMTEIRLNETLLGATHIDRVRGRVTIGIPVVTTSTPAPANTAVVRDEVADRRARLTQGA
jgi:hypothetical protein